MKKLIALVLLSLCCGCAAIKDHVVVTTSTVLGFEVAQNPASGLYQARLGYCRAEFALVPTNGVDVLTELRWNAIFTTGGIYQRMAVGKTACESSALMFLRDRDGKLDPQALTSATQLLQMSRSTNR